eukprot:jgi/Hompol1/587/HPOL_004258-RA
MVQAKSLNPITTHYEFMGPHGTLLAILGLPIVVAGLFVACTSEGCPAGGSVLDGLEGITDIAAAIAKTAASAEWLNAEANTAIAAWFLLHCVLYLAVPGREIQGTKLRNGQSLSYAINGFSILLLSIAATAAAVFTRGLAPLIWIADNYLQLAMAATILAFGLALMLYLASFRSSQVLLAEGGNSGYPIYDFWMGRELNPRIFGVDLKYMCELRPGLIGWAVLNAALVAKQYSTFGYVSNSMVAVCVFQAYYVIDALWNEPAILTTMDITTDGFGFMLVFGDLVWVPFTYSLQARYLAMYPQNLSSAYLAFVVALNMLGLWVFRGSNGEKNAFRTNPNDKSVKHLRFITTKSGSKLLVTGWWGAARKINYTGDWLMALAWCLPCGFATPVPYFYAIYFAVLLVHRASRDDALCRAKYGADWTEYCKRVPYLFVPYLF